MSMVTSQILKFVNFSETKKSRYLENETLIIFSSKERIFIINYISRATLWQKIFLQRRLSLKQLKSNVKGLNLTLLKLIGSPYTFINICYDYSKGTFPAKHLFFHLFLDTCCSGSQMFDHVVVVKNYANFIGKTVAGVYF